MTNLTLALILLATSAWGQFTTEQFSQRFHGTYFMCRDCSDDESENVGEVPCCPWSTTTSTTTSTTSTTRKVYPLNCLHSRYNIEHQLCAMKARLEVLEQRVNRASALCPGCLED